MAQVTANGQAGQSDEPKAQTEGERIYGQMLATLRNEHVKRQIVNTADEGCFSLAVRFKYDPQKGKTFVNISTDL